LTDIYIQTTLNQAIVAMQFFLFEKDATLWEVMKLAIRVIALYHPSPTHRLPRSNPFEQARLTTDVYAFAFKMDNLPFQFLNQKVPLIKS
jgi:hypothetical protein